MNVKEAVKQEKGKKKARNVKEEVIESRRISWLHITTCNWSEIASLLAE